MMPVSEPHDQSPPPEAAAEVPVNARPDAEAVEPLCKVYFMRHAPAEDRAAWEGPDDARPLTDKGRKRFRREAKGLRALVGTPDAILTSPYARAQETADLAARALKFTSPVELEDHLVHGGDPRMLGKLLEARQGARSVVLVGHSPDLERWIGWLATGRDEAPFMELKKGGVCRVDVTTLAPEPRGVIRWLVTPGTLRELD